MPATQVPKKTLWQTIRATCLDCSGESAGTIEFCTCKTCPNYKYRFGRPPKTTDYVFQPGDERYELGQIRAIHQERAKTCSIEGRTPSPACFGDGSPSKGSIGAPHDE